MLRSLNEVTGYTLAASDGELGRVADFLFDDRLWVVRYMVADTGGWLSGHKVLVSPIALGNPDWEARLFPVNLSREQIENAPPLDEDAPVSREYERNFYEHYGFGLYWAGADLWGATPDPWGAIHPVTEPELPPADEDIAPADEDIEPEENHLRSTREVGGYDVHASDGELGHIDDFIVNDANWAIRWLVVDTRNWLPGRKVLVSPDWVTEVDWVTTSVSFDVTRDRIRESPEYDPAKPVNAEYEKQLYDFYGRPVRR